MRRPIRVVGFDGDARVCVQAENSSAIGKLSMPPKEDGRRPPSSRQTSDYWVIIPLLLGLLLLFFWRVAVLNGFELFSLATLREAAPWVIGLVVLIVAREILERVRQRRRK
jgi:hypothetical protein